MNRWRALALVTSLFPRTALGQAEEPSADGSPVGGGIVVTAQRLAEPGRPDTQVRLTAAELQRHGVTDLAQALDLISDTPTRASGRQLSQVNIRGARKGGVLLLIDGTPVSDPFTGNFDIASIPSTDIAEIRVSLTPASPLDGPGGNGGVIEVLTRSASGPAFLRGALQGSTGPSGTAAVTGRTPLGEHTGLRASATGALDTRDQPVTLRDGTRRQLNSDGQSGSAGLRVERRTERGRLTLDVAAAHRKYLIPPGDSPDAGVSTVPDEDSFRGVLGGTLRQPGAVASIRLFSNYVDHSGVNYENATFDEAVSREHVTSHRSGGVAQVDLNVGSDVRATAVAHLQVEGGDDTVEINGTETNTTGRTSVFEPAVGALWQTTSFLALEGALGLAAPLGHAHASAWPEAKVQATLTPVEVFQLRLVGARKGRLPSLRDRFSPVRGNPTVGPEMGTSIETTATFEPREQTLFEVSAFVRLTDGLIRNPPADTVVAAGGGTQPVENAGDITVYGGEARASVAPLEWLTTAIAYAYADARSEALGTEPLDFFPRHRLEGTLTARFQSPFGLWARGRYTGARLDNTFELEPYTTLDAAAWARWGVARFTLRGENLTNTSYDLRAAVPAFGRTLFLGVEGVLE